MAERAREGRCLAVPLKKLLLHIRCIFKHARKRKIMVENPTEDLRAKSKQRVCERYLSVDECRRLLSVLVGRDHLIVRMFIQLGLRPEEMFALRRDDVQGDRLRIDEALVEGQSRRPRRRHLTIMCTSRPTLNWN